PAEARRRPAPHRRERVGEPHALARVRAAHQLDTGALAHVHRRDRDHPPSPARAAIARPLAAPPGHAASATSTARNRTPSRELFSGWNWTPTVRPARTTAGKRSSW